MLPPVFGLKLSGLSPGLFFNNLEQEATEEFSHEILLLEQYQGMLSLSLKNRLETLYLWIFFKKKNTFYSGMKYLIQNKFHYYWGKMGYVGFREFFINNKAVVL